MRAIVLVEHAGADTVESHTDDDTNESKIEVEIK